MPHVIPTFCHVPGPLTKRRPSTQRRNSPPLGQLVDPHLSHRFFRFPLSDSHPGHPPRFPRRGEGRLPIFVPSWRPFPLGLSRSLPADESRPIWPVSSRPWTRRILRIDGSSQSSPACFLAQYWRTPQSAPPPRRWTAMNWCLDPGGASSTPRLLRGIPPHRRCRKMPFAQGSGVRQCGTISISACGCLYRAWDIRLALASLGGCLCRRWDISPPSPTLPQPQASSR